MWSARSGSGGRGGSASPQGDLVVTCLPAKWHQHASGRPVAWESGPAVRSAPHKVSSPFPISAVQREMERSHKTRRVLVAKLENRSEWRSLHTPTVSPSDQITGSLPLS